LQNNKEHEEDYIDNKPGFIYSSQAIRLETVLIFSDSFSRIDFYDDCDACGCAAGNGSSGFESLLNPQFIGIKYFAQHYKAKKICL
jgi:hypothetical protein